MIETPQLDPLREAQKELTKMLAVIHNICKDHNISYWLDGGTLIGCIRHSGFIPWDDDIDICMLREDYNKFKKIIKQYLPNPYKVESYKLNIHGKHNWTKIMYLDDFVWDNKETEEISQGVSIDVFPFDFVPKAGEPSTIGKAVHKVAKLLYLPNPTTFKHRIARVINKSQLHNIYAKFNKKSSVVTYGVETAFYGSAYYDVNDIIPVSEGLFEGYTFNIPNNYDRYLRLYYGDYMKIPDEEDRTQHTSNIRMINK